MNQEEEIIFSWNKIKRIFLKYWYIILITFALGAAFVGFKAYKTVAASKAVVNKTAAGSQDSSGIELTSANLNAEDNLSPTGTTYFNITRYVKVDWSEIYPEVNVSNDNSAEDNYYILSRINNQSSKRNKKKREFMFFMYRKITC